MNSISNEKRFEVLKMKCPHQLCAQLHCRLQVNNASEKFAIKIMNEFIRVITQCAYAFIKKSIDTIDNAKQLICR